MATKKGFGYILSLDIKDFEKACKNVQKLMDKTFGNDIMKMSNTAVKALGAISAAMAGIGAAAFAMGRKLDSVLTGLQGIWGSAKDAADQYERLKLIAENSSFGIDSLTAVDKKIAALGLSATESASLIVRLGNTVTATNGTAQNLEQMADALLRIKTTGEVSTRSLMVFAEAGIKIDDLIGGDATNAINTLIDRMQKFNGYMQGESTDIWTQYDRSVKIVQDALAKLGNYINDNFKEYVVAVVDKISQLRDKFVELLSDKDGLEAVYNVFKRIAQAITVLALPALARLAVGFTPVIVQAAGVVAAISAIAFVIDDLCSENSVLMHGINNIWTRFKWLGAKIAEGLSDTFITVMNAGVEAFNYILNSAVSLINKALNYFEDKIIAFIQKLGIIAGTVGAEELQDSFNDLYEKWAKNGVSIKAPEAEKLKGLADDGNRDSDQIALEFEAEDEARDAKLAELANKFEAVKNSLASVFDFSGIAGSVDVAIKHLEQSSIGKVIANNKGEQSLTEFTGGRIGFLEDAYGQMLSITKKFIKENENEWKDFFDALKTNGVNKMADIFNEAAWSGKNFFKSMGEGLQNLGKQILQSISKMLILRTLFRAFGISYGNINVAQIAGLNSHLNDGIVQNGRIITTHPDDYIIATKTPETLGNGKANVVVNVHNNAGVKVETNSYFDGTRTIIDLFMDGYSRNVNGVKDMIRG